MSRPSTFALVAALLLAVPARAIVTSDVAGSHLTAPGEPSFGVNTDGVVLVGAQFPNADSINDLLFLCSGALISDRHILSAGHCYDEDFDGLIDPLLTAVPHVAAFELADGLVMIPIDVAATRFPDSWPGGAVEASADLAILTLAAAAPADAPRYVLYAGTNEVGRPAVPAGYGGTGHGSTGEIAALSTTPAKRAGLNRIEAVRFDLPGIDFLASDFDSGLAENNALPLLGFPSDLGFGADEVGIGGGDSGGPAFIGGAITGVHSGTSRQPGADVTTEIDSSWGDLNFSTRVSTYRDFIVEATGGAARFVTAADYDLDGDVDGADFLVWQRGESPIPLAPADLAVWESQFGVATTHNSSTSVPEPGALMQLTAAGALGVLLRRRREQRRLGQFPIPG